MSGWLGLQKILDRKDVDPLDIVNEFTTRPPDQKPCPIGPNDDYWLKKLCALADQMAKNAKDRLRIIEEYKASVEDLAKEHSSLKKELALADGVCRELRYLIAQHGGVHEGNYGDNLKDLLERWLETSTSKFKYERPTFIKPLSP